MSARAVVGLLVLALGTAPSWAAPVSSVNGLPGVTGLTVHAGTHALYVKSGISGTVWHIPIGPNGALGAAEAVSMDLGSAIDVEFDLAGNFYGVIPGGRPFSLFVRRVMPAVPGFQQTNISPSGFTSFSTALTGAFAIETPGGGTNRIFVVSNEFQIFAFQIGNFAPARSTTAQVIDACAYRYVAYRPRFADLIGSWNREVRRTSSASGGCEPIAGGDNLVQPTGVAWDNASQNIYVADAATGDLIVIKPDGSRLVLETGLSSPADIAFDAGYLFIAEPAAGRVSAFSATPPVALPTSTPAATPTASVSPTPIVALCVGNCDGSGEVTVDEILSLVNIALGNGTASTCTAGDANQDGEITVDEILSAVNNALGGCRK